MIRETYFGKQYVTEDGQKYQLLFLAQDAETKKKMAVYQRLSGAFEIFTQDWELFQKRFEEDGKESVIGGLESALQKKLEAFEEKNDFKGDSYLHDAGGEKTSVDEALKKAQHGNGVPAVEGGNEKEEAGQIAGGVEGSRGKTKKDQEEEVNNDLIRFLDAETCKEKIEILLLIQERLDKRLLSNIAAALDIGLEDGTEEEYLEVILSCLRTRARFEVRR